MLPATLHPAVEGPPIREVEARQPRLPLCAKDGGGDRVGFAIVFRHRDHPLGAVLDLEALLVPRREVPVPQEVIARQVEEGLGEEVEHRIGRQGTEVTDHAGGGEPIFGGQHCVEVRQAATFRRCSRSEEEGDGLQPRLPLRVPPGRPPPCRLSEGVSGGVHGRRGLVSKGRVSESSPGTRTASPARRWVPGTRD